MSVPANQVTVGKHPLTDYGGAGQYGLSLAADGIACGSVRGTENVLEVARRSDGSLLRAHIQFTTLCGDGSGTATADFRWRDRTDVTAPTSPRTLTLSGTPRTVTWTRSASSDTATTLVRLVPGDGTGATVTSGLPVAMTASGSAPLPAVRAGAQYTLPAWAVDTTGNVSAPRTLAVRG